MRAEPIYATLARANPSFKCAKLFWWFNQGAAAQLTSTVSPSMVVTTRFGYHVMRLESKTAPTVRSFAESRPAIEARLVEVKARLRMKQVIDGLVSQAQVNHEAVTAR